MGPWPPAFAAHERWAFGEAYRRYAGLLYSTAYNVLYNTEEAEDCIADAIAKLWRSPGAYATARGNLRSFLVVCVRNEAISRRRRESRRARLTERLAAMPVEHAELRRPDPIERDRVRSAMLALPIEQRTRARTCVLRRKDAERNRGRARRAAGHDQEPDQARFEKARLAARFRHRHRGRSMTYEHVADLAELYALGALADDERAAVDAHLRDALACARAIGAAEEDVARIAAADTQWNVPPGVSRSCRRLAARAAATPASPRARSDTGVAVCRACGRAGSRPAAVGISLVGESRDARRDADAERRGRASRVGSASHDCVSQQRRAHRRGGDVSERRIVVRRAGARCEQGAAGCVDARRRAHDARQRRSARRTCDALPSEEPPNGPARAHGWRSDRRGGDAAVAKNDSKSSRRSIRVAGGSDARIVAP